ncbi:MAG: OmpA family protein [Candidatus Aminicenantales bacterium]
MNTYRRSLNLFAVLCLSAVFFAAAWNGVGGFAPQQKQDEWLIPPDAQTRAIRALKSLGPDRGAKKITYRVVEVIGVSRDIRTSRIELMKSLKDLGARETGTEVRIDLPGDILFDFDKWDVREDAVEILKKIASVIKAYKSPKVTIAGYTDSKGDDDYNQKLSEKRAESVKSWLVKNGGVDAKALVTFGYGETKPVALNVNPDGSDNPEGRQKNRRVEIVIQKQ